MSDYASTSSRPTSPIGDLPNIPSARPYRFTWDANATPRKPGPGSVSETTEGRGATDYFVTPGTTTFDTINASGSSLTLGALPSEWSSTLHGFHAISTVVNSPHKRSAPPKAHSSLPAVPPADLPRVRRKDFDAYLRSVAPEWERFEQNAEQGREGEAQIDGPASLQEQQASFLSSNLGVDDIPRTPRTPRLPPGKPLTPLETVPDIYFDSKFNLGDPRTFDLVTEHGTVDGLDFTDASSLNSSQPLLDKLSRHADTIEQHLVREISIRSTSFFAALSNLQDLQSESEQCLDRIAKLRGLLKEVDEKGARKGLEIVRLESRLRNVGIVREGVKVIGGVVEMASVAKGLVGAGQWGEALDVIEGLEALYTPDEEDATSETMESLHPPVPTTTVSRPSSLATVMESPPQTPTVTQSPTTILSTKPPSSVPISALNAFASLPAHLRDLTMEIATSLSSEVVNVLRLDLIDRIDTGKDGHAHMGVQMSLKDRLRPLLQSLVRTHGIGQAASSWKEVCLGEARNVLKRRVPAFDLDDDDPSSAKSQETIAALLAMPQESFMKLAGTMFTSYLNCIEGLQVQNNIIVEVVEAIRHPKSNIDMSSLREDLSDILSSAGELANVRASKVINYRNEQHTSLDLPAFYTFFNESWDFVVKSEVICKRMIVALRGVIVSQSKTFLQAFHQSRLSQSAKLVEDEQWNPAEVSASVQRIVDMLVDSSISDPRDLLLNPPPLIHPSSPMPPSSPALSATLTPNGPGAPIRPSSPLPSPAPNRTVSNGLSPRRSATHSGKHLKIEDRHYFAVHATLEVLILLVDYLKVIMNLPMLTTDTMSRIIELLKAFNSRTCQVVLGAGAMRSAGLKNITAKHLALASQSLSIMISLIPYIRETFRRHLSPKQAVMLVEFDKMKRDYQEHQNEIHAKLIAIMGDRLTAHIRTLQAIKWDVPKQGDGVNDYMELLVKETVTLHKVLSRYLSPSVVEFVMTQVFAAINHRLSEEYTSIELPSQEAKDRLLADAKYLHQKLTGLKNVGAPTAMLEIVIQEKSIARKVPPTPTPAPHPVTTTNSRFKNILGAKRASSLLMPTSPPAQVVPDFEKSLPVPNPPTITSVTPSPPPLPSNRLTSPPPADVKSSTSPHPLNPPTKKDIVGPNTPKPDDQTNGVAVLPPSDMIVTSPAVPEKSESNLGVPVPVPIPSYVSTEDEVPPPTPPKSERPVGEQTPAPVPVESETSGTLADHVDEVRNTNVKTTIEDQSAEVEPNGGLPDIEHVLTVVNGDSDARQSGET
ncbi:Vps54-like protein-domain-containing protein [Abortiporus biennis]|nr:Vps54-like protein-domain-containing protein [Abortiporus biennis]